MCSGDYDNLPGCLEMCSGDYDDLSGCLEMSSGVFDDLPGCLEMCSGDYVNCSGLYDWEMGKILGVWKGTFGTYGTKNGTRNILLE